MVVRLDDNYLLGRNALGYEFLANVLIEVESALLILITRVRDKILQFKAN